MYMHMCACIHRWSQPSCYPPNTQPTHADSHVWSEKNATLQLPVHIFRGSVWERMAMWLVHEDEYIMHTLGRFINLTKCTYWCFEGMGPRELNMHMHTPTGCMCLNFLLCSPSYPLYLGESAFWMQMHWSKYSGWWASSEWRTEELYITSQLLGTCLRALCHSFFSSTNNIHSSLCRSLHPCLPGSYSPGENMDSVITHHPCMYWEEVGHIGDFLSIPPPTYTQVWHFSFLLSLWYV